MATPPEVPALSFDLPAKAPVEALPVVALLLLLLGVFFTDPLPVSLPTPPPPPPTPPPAPFTLEELLFTTEEGSFFSFRDATASAFLAALFSCETLK